MLPAAAPGSAARALLDRHLATFLLDARLVLQLSGRNDRLAESASTDLLTGLPTAACSNAPSAGSRPTTP